jgi:biotin transport system ATP-binding protein
MPLIVIKHLTHRFADGTLGLDDVDFSVREGTLVVVAGRNGSGKTTLLKHLNGLLSPSAGTVTIAGVPVAKDVRRARQMVGLVFQDADSQIVGETVAADVAFGPENLCLPRPEILRRVAAALETVGLTALADRPPHLLSGGEKRRVCIAGVLAMKPAVLALDEPLAGIDYPGARQVLEKILELKQAGRTVIVTTHDVEKVLYHADRLLVMDRGRVVRDGLPRMVVQGIDTFGVREPCSVRFGKGVASWLT